MWWKVYFWVYIGLVVIGYIEISISNGFFPAIVEFLVTTLIFVIGLYSYVFKKRIFPTKVWTVIFWIAFILLLFFLWVRFNYKPFQEELIRKGVKEAEDIFKAPTLIDFFEQLVYVPVYLAIFKLGYPNFKLNSPDFKKRLWKVYFWIIAVFNALGLLSQLSTLSSWNFALWLSNVEAIALVVGLHSYVFKKEVFGENIWKYALLVIIADYVLYTVYLLTKLPALSFINPNNIPETPVSAEIFGTIVLLPALYAIYKLGFSAKKKEGIYLIMSEEFLNKLPGLALAIFCLWRGLLAIKTKKMHLRPMSGFETKGWWVSRSKVVVYGYLLVIVGVLLIVVGFIKPL